MRKKNRSLYSIAILLTKLVVQSLNDYRLLFFGLPTKILGIWDFVIYCWKDLETTFPVVYYTPQILNIAVGKSKK
jgi:hypothetical protein